MQLGRGATSTPQYTTRPPSANQFMYSTPSPYQTMEMGPSLSTGDPGPSSISHTRLDVTVTTAQNAPLQHDSDIPSTSRCGSANEGSPATFAIMSPERPPSSSSTLGSPSQHAQTPQGLSHPSPPRQQSPLQEMHMSPVQLSERLSASALDSTRPQSQPQRPPSNQLAGSSLAPNVPSGPVPADGTLLQGQASIGGGSCFPPQPYSCFCKAIGDGQLPLTSASSAGNGDPSRHPGAPGTLPTVPRSVYIQVLVVFALLTPLWLCSHPPAIGHGQALMRVLQFSAMLAAEDPEVWFPVCSQTGLSLTHLAHSPINYDSHIGKAWWRSFS